MTNLSQRPGVLFVMAAVAIGAFDLGAGLNWLGAREGALAAQEQFATADDLARKIESLRSAPVRVEEQVKTREALARLVETAAKKVGLDPTRIAHIVPGDPRRIAESDYLEQATDIELREVPLKQVVEFTIALGQSGPGLGVSTLSLRVPPGADSAPQNQELWNVQLLLTSRIYAPKIPTPAPDPTHPPLSP